MFCNPPPENTAVVLAEEGRIKRKSRGVGGEEISEAARLRRKSRQEERRKSRKRSRMEEVLAEGGCAVGKPLVVCFCHSHCCWFLLHN